MWCISMSSSNMNTGTDTRRLDESSPRTFDYDISKEDLEALRAYREYRKIREASGWRPRRFDDKEGIRKDLMGEWLGTASGRRFG